MVEATQNVVNRKAASRVSDALMQKAREVIRRGRKSVDSVDPAWLAKRMGSSQGKVAVIIDLLRKESPAKAKLEQTETSTIQGDSWEIALPKTRICTLDELLAHCKVDTSTWEVDRFVCNKWEVGAKDKNCEVQVHPLFQVKAWLKRRVAVSDTTAIVERLRRMAEGYAPKYPVIRFRDLKRTGNLLEPCIYDQHFGKLCWGKETGWADYDSKLADRLFDEAFNVLVQRTKSEIPDEILLVFGNDLQHTDNMQGTTTRGTPQTTDSRYHKVYDVTMNRLIKTVEVARQLAPKVTVKMVAGNHDTASTYTVGWALSAWFRQCAGVSIDNSPLLRKYHQHGRTMFMLTHGNDVKLDKLPGLMASEQRKMWGDTIFHEIHTGHKHQREKLVVPELKETNGVVIRILPSLCPPDAWHSVMGYVGNIRMAEAYVWNDREGLISTASFSVPHEWPEVSA